MSYGIIYKITNKINGKVYIGQSTKLLNLRWAGHLDAARAGIQKSKLQDAIRQFGPEAFNQEVIATAENAEELDILEKEAIRSHDSQKNGYNTMSGGQHPPELSITAQKTKVLARTGLNASEISKEIGIKEETLFHAAEEYGLEELNCTDFYHVEYDDPAINSDQYDEASNGDSLSVWEDAAQERFRLYTNYLESTR